MGCGEEKKCGRGEAEKFDLHLSFLGRQVNIERELDSVVALQS